jgi:hypothetical protein
MNYKKEEIENRLKEILDDLLSTINQDGSIISLDYDESKNECVVKMDVFINEDDNFIGFQSY